MIIDFHTHIGKGEKVSASLDELENSMKSAYIDFSILSPLKTKNLLQKSCEIFKASKEFVLPFLRFDPNKIKIKDLKKQIINFDGIKLHPRLEDFDILSEKYEKIFRIILNFKKPVLIHTRKENNKNTDPDRIIKIAELYPKINFVFAHFANDSNRFFEQINNYSNLFVDTSIVSSPKIIELRVKQIGSEKIIFGSDFPYSDQEIEKMKVLKSKISKEERNNIFYKNARKLLKE